MKPITEPETSEQTLHPEFEKIYREYFPMVCAAAYIVLGSRADAKDVAQNVFTRLAERGFSPDKTQNLKAYLYGAATRQARCVIRWRGRRKYTDDGLECLEDSAMVLQDHPLSGLLQNAMDRLKPEWANMMLLRYEFGHTEAEIAEMSGRSRTMVSVTLTRARRRVKKLMEREMGGKQ
jgi:RNA polymerase sigma-70 factor (ECF subfamily)